MAEVLFPDRTLRSRVLGSIQRELGFGALGVDALGIGAPGDLPQNGWLRPGSVIPCGIPCLDWVLGLGGLPRGHIVELFGPEHAGKSTLALTMIAGAQAAGATVALIDAAHQLDAAYAMSLGVRGEDLLISHPSHAEQALGIAETLACSGAVDLIAVDSVSAMIPQSEIVAAPVAEPSGSTAVALLRVLRRMRPALRRSPCCLLLLDQLRDRDYFPFGSPETTVSARTLNPFASVRMLIRRAGDGEGRRAAGLAPARVSVLKNRLGPMGRSTEVAWDSRTMRIVERGGSRREPLAC